MCLRRAPEKYIAGALFEPIININSHFKTKTMSEYCYIFSQNFLEAWYSIRYSLTIYTYFLFIISSSRSSTY
jgi:hypothetical protein